jgi:hypothetical protein
METLLDFLLHADLRKDGERLCYDDAEAGILKRRREKNPGLGADKMKEDSAYWKEIFDYLKATENGWEQFQDLMAKEASSLEQDILAFITGGNPMKCDSPLKQSFKHSFKQSFKQSLRQYIVGRCGELGIYSPPKPINSKKAVEKACKKLNIPQKEAAEVYGRFDSIMKGEVYESDIKYDGPPDPFIDVLQEMMLDTGMGKILSGMSLGRGYESDQDNIPVKDFIAGELKDMGRRIAMGSYQWVDVLRVNSRYAGLPLVKRILKTIKLPEGGSLTDKIKALESAPFDDDAVLEAVIPFRRGYMDWNTLQAVWRINRDLRPNGFFLYRTVDQDFLEPLFEAYAD